MPKERAGRQSANFEDAAGPEVNTMMQVGFKASEDLIPKFDGRDKIHTVAKWIQDVEDNAEIMHWTPIQQLIFARRSLTGTAALWIKSERPFKTWEELKQGMAKEFPDTIDQKTLHEMMGSRKKQVDESCQDYLLVMKEMGRRGKMVDYVAIKYIIEGIQDAEIHKIMLYGATTYPDLKERLRTYENMKKRMKTEPSWRTRREASDNMAVGAKYQDRGGIRVTRCYNCGDLSHQSQECPNRHLGLKCFKCNAFGHIASSCQLVSHQSEHTSRSGGDGGGQSGAGSTNFTQNPQPFTPRTFNQSFRQNDKNGGQGGQGREVRQPYGPKRTMFATDLIEFSDANMKNDVPFTTDDRKEDMDMTAVCNKVDVDKDDLAIDNSKNIMRKSEKDVKILDTWTSALVDTGSQVNLLAESFYDEIGAPRRDSKTLAVSGLGQTKVYSREQVTVPLMIDGQSYCDVVFHIVPKDSMLYNIIIGQEFLFNVMLVLHKGNVMLLPSGEYWVCNKSGFISEVSSSVKGREVSKELQSNDVVGDERPMKTKDVPNELRIISEYDSPVAQQPLRLAINEQDEMEKQIKDAAEMTQLNMKDIYTFTRVARWIMTLLELKVAIEHTDGSQMRYAGTLSRSTYAARVVSNIQEKIKLAQTKDMALEAIVEIMKFRKHEDHWLGRGLLLKGLERRLVVPESKENGEEWRIKAKEHMFKAQEKNRRDYKKKRKKSRKYTDGDVMAIRRTQFNGRMKSRPKDVGPYKITTIKGFERYDVEKMVDQSKEGPEKTSSAADIMKPWLTVNDTETLSDKGSDGNDVF